MWTCRCRVASVLLYPMEDSVRPGAVILEYHRRGWLSPGCAAAGLRFASDIVTVDEVPVERGLDPACRIAGSPRLAEVRRAATEPVELLEAVARDDHAPGLWSRTNGQPQRDGFPRSASALRAIRLSMSKTGRNNGNETATPPRRPPARTSSPARALEAVYQRQG